MSDLYDVARQITDEVMGEGTYAETNRGNPDPGVQAAIARGDPDYPGPHGRGEARGETDEYWRGYAAALLDLERAIQAGRNPMDWLVQVRLKFGLEE